MNDDPPTPKSRRGVLEDAALWRAKLDSGSADLSDFERWRDADPHHAVAYAEILAAWRDAGAAHAYAPPATAGRFLTRRAAAAAFGVCALAGAAGLGLRAEARETAVTAIGERRSIRIGDAIRLDLNTDTAISWRASADGVTLWQARGEIAFDIAAAGALNFIAGQITGAFSSGSYNARLLGAVLDVTVAEGAARLRSGDGAEVEARRNERLRAAGDHITRAAATPDVLAALAGWRRGEIVLIDAPLAEALADYNRYLTRKFVVLDPQIARLRIGGRFSTDNPAQFLRALETAFAVRAVETSDAVLLTRAS